MTLLLRGARLVGGDDRLVDLLVRDGRIAALGPEVKGDAATEVIDLDGRFVHPGLWDGHVHSGQVSTAGRRLDVSGAESAAEVVALVRARLEVAPPSAGEVMLGFGFRDGLWPEEPQPDDLELGEHAVSLVSGDVHTVWSNRAALATIGRGPGDWWLREQDAFDANIAFSAVPDAVLDRWAIEDAAVWARRGVVGIHDLEMEDAPGAWARRVAAGFDGLRVRAGVYPAGLDAAAGIRTGDEVEGTRGLVVGGNFKLFTDGSLNTRTAWCSEPYPDLEGDDAFGLATYDLDELVALAREGLSRGLVPTIHAIGDRAVTMALDAFAALGPLPGGARGRLEHAQLVAARDLPRFAALGVVASVQPAHALDDREVADHFWAGRTDRAFPLRALRDAGAELALGSDAPVAALDPWVTISAAVSRTRDGRPAWHPEQGITTAEALAASVGGGPARVEAGGVADLIVLEADPLSASGDELASMPVAGTMLAGRWTHRAF
ncbi:amidohydrolase [uncultured Schumannella sp.]|uniref:amidohydrolase n=1 Tax=uncultured Schumannella sp. TaxID=1195956 RepID=UPI0025D55152|nr:amidohydrolase family protein [uncultured Schumannella sp.]